MADACKNRTAASRADARAPLGVYVHVPFCVKRCDYCDFLSFADADEPARRSYVRALRREIALRAESLSYLYYVDTVFVGGGTPSCLKARLIGDVLDALTGAFSVSADAEISMEANPGTIRPAKLRAWKSAGVNRLSLGVQSLNDGLLSRLGRAHDARTARAAFGMARRAGFRNVSADLIFAIPGQSEAECFDDLAGVVAEEPEHLSFYGLQTEKGTRLSRLIRRGKLTETDDETDRRMYHGILSRIEAAGYAPYEISSAARPGFACRHNLKYWSGADYLGLGLGAHSFLGGARESNRTDPAAYGAARTLRDFRARRHVNTDRDTLSEYVFLGLRKRDGLDARDFRARFGRGLFEMFHAEIARFTDEGLLETETGADEKPARLRLTARGIDVSNTVFAAFV